MMQSQRSARDPKRPWAAAAVAMWCTASSIATAAAQAPIAPPVAGTAAPEVVERSRRPIRLASGLGLGAAGGLTTDMGGGSEDTDLAASWSTFLELRLPIGAVLEIAPELALTTWNTSAGSDNDLARIMSFDFGAAFYLGFDAGPTRIYARMPIGFSFSFLPEQRLDPPATNVDDEAGYHFGIGAGVLVTLGDTGSVFLDVGYFRRASNHTVSAPFVGGDYELATDELLIRVGPAVSL